MGKTREMVATTASTQMRIEYVRARRTLRLTATHGEGPQLAPVEVPVASLVERLGIDGSDLVPPAQVLLFAGLHARPRGGAGDLVAWFESAAEGRAAFRQLREERTDHEGWAELVALDGKGRRSMLAWFGRSGDPKDREPKPRQLRLVVSRRHPAQTGRSHLRLSSR